MKNLQDRIQELNYTALPSKLKPILKEISESESDLSAYYNKVESDAKFATKASLPTKVSQLTNDSNFITVSQVPAPDLTAYYKKTETDTKYATKAEQTTALGLKADKATTYTKAEVDAAIAAAIAAIPAK